MNASDRRVPAEVFVDRLTFGSLLRATRLRGGHAGHLRILEAPAPGFHRNVLTRTARLLGWRVTIESFFSGHLFNAAGESIYRVARRESGLVAFEAASDLVARIPDLHRLNTRFGRDLLRLFVTRRAWPDLERGFRAVLAARAIAGGDARSIRAVVECPRYVDARWFRVAAPNAEVVVWGVWRGVLHGVASALDGLYAARRRPPTAAAHARPPGSHPAVLQVREDALGMDRSIRSQPHWIDASASPAVSTYIWTERADEMPASESAAAAAADVSVVGEPEAQAMATTFRDHPLLVELARESAGLLRRALMAGRVSDALALAGTGKLLQRARVAAGVALALDAKVFLSGESHLTDAAALQLVAPVLGVRTISYQYSNISLVSPLMMTTADVMLVFSPMYAANWCYRGVAPQMFAELGYPYDGAFRRVAARAESLRRTLATRGASIVIAFFDESVQQTMWGQIDADEHRSDILQLAELVLRDPGAGVIIKTQFARNAPSQLFGGDPRLQAALATGRFVEAARDGGTRNVLFPSEAAQAADIVIGHAVGGTAVLEAALSGRRSLMLNPNGWTGTWDGVYGEAHVMVRDMATALDDIAQWRAGSSAAAGLGDWTPILPQFDAYRDGAAPVRLARFIEQLAASGDIIASLAAAGLRRIEMPLETDAA